jgi:5-methylthioadenosine/S-adenosylhomocysteine deaminase
LIGLPFLAGSGSPFHKGIDMKTLIKGGWVVGHEGQGHTLIPSGQIAFEGDKILYVGRQYEGHADRVIDAQGMLVSPGFIDTHVHAGYQASHRLISDRGRPDFFGQPFLEFNTPRKGTAVGGDPRYFTAEERRLFADDPWASFTVVELLRNGITTFVEMGAPVPMQEALAAVVSDVGTRAYLGAGYDIGGWVGVDDGRLERVVNEEYGRTTFEQAIRFSKAIDKTADGRVRAILAPKRVETCSIEQLEATARLARELDLPVCIHAAYNVHEFYDVVRRHQLTPIQLLEKVGLLSLGPRLNIGHGNFVAEHPRLAYSGGQDIPLMGRYRCTVSHCCVNLVRRARYLDSWAKYKEAGVNMALGTDTYPRDMMMQMRTASYFGKVLARDLQSASAGEMFHGATVAGADALGRGDLGRLKPGAQADIILIDMGHGDHLRYGPIRDPIKSVVECGIGDDVDTAIVAGKILMRHRRIEGVSYDRLRGAAQQMAEHIWNSWQQWDMKGRTAEEMAPMSFPIR